MNSPYFKIATSVAVVVVTALLANIFLSGDTPSENSAPFKPTQDLRVVEKRRSESLAKAPVCTEKKEPLVQSVKLKRSNAFGSAVDDLIAEGYENPSSLVEAARTGNGSASIALFTLVRNCYSIKLSKPGAGFGPGNSSLKPTSSNCPALPSDVVENPLGILEVAAANGSADAKLVYAMNAVAFSTYYRSRNDSSFTLAASSITKRAEIFGESAVRAGLIEGFSFMSDAYERGEFGVRDPELAYTYGLPLLQNVQSPALARRMKKLELQLSPGQIETSQISAFGCARMMEEATIKSPF